MKTTEKSGLFYLGKVFDSTGKAGAETFQLESKNLTTHAVCVGMTGSGKTGLGIALLEGAAIDGIPAIIIDPKGDVADLLLAFPNLSASDFQPWVDAGQATREGLTVQQYAEETAKTWKKGLTEWGEDGARIQKYKDSVDMTIYTPANPAGASLSVLSSLKAPPKEIVDDATALRERVLSTTSGLLGLLGIQADPINSKEHILISTILEKSWKEGQGLDLTALIQQIQKPPFTQVGAMALDTFYPAKDRLKLSMTLNNLLASPAFQAWMEGEPLDIQKLLYTAEGRPRHSIISIAHLSDPERMFVVTLILNEYLGWMRRQPGTSGLRALFYMDEIFGYFPPTAAPPSKMPMITLLKQARAFGVGIILATQNPVDLDYKGLSNCGTWFIGKLQTERDRSRVIDGLQSASNGDTSISDMKDMLALCGKRVFIMRSVYEKKPILFQTRWTLSYLAGPLTLPQIQLLMDKQGKRSKTASAPAASGDRSSAASDKPGLPMGFADYTIRSMSGKSTSKYRPLMLGIGKLHFVDAKNKIDTWQETVWVAPFSDDGQDVQWDAGEAVTGGKDALIKSAPISGQFEDLPAAVLNAKNSQAFEKSFVSYLYQNQTIDLFSVPNLKLLSNAGESEAEFKERIKAQLLSQHNGDSAAMKADCQAKINALQERIRKSNEKLSGEQGKAGRRKFDLVISFLKAGVTALLGRKVISSTTISQAGSSMKKASQIGKESDSISGIEQDIVGYNDQIVDLQAKMAAEDASLMSSTDVDKIVLDKVSIRPRKTDIMAETVALMWWPVG